jgi:DNA polymerase-1
LFNHPVQGLNADITKLALAKLFRALTNSKAKLICTVHDEIVLECPEEEVQQVSRILHQCMVWAAQKFLAPIPVMVELQVSPSW